MTATERVLAALAYQPVDRIPLFDSYWGEFVAAWQQQKRLGPDVDINDYYGIDIAICTPDETPWPSQAATLERTPAGEVARDGWGATQPHHARQFLLRGGRRCAPGKGGPGYPRF